jgi:hypothetical protein
MTKRSSRSRARLSHAVRHVIALGVTSAILMVIAGRPSRADVALCGSFPVPHSDAQALRQAPFAFDGVAIKGRVEVDPTGGTALVSPLTFRVTRWIKGESSHAITLPTGAEGILIWDGRYARLPEKLLEGYSVDVERRFPGELTAFPGQRWRIYATTENGINFTCTNLLGSHPLGTPGSAGLPSSSEPSRPIVGARPVSTWVVALVLVLSGAVAVALLANAVRRRRCSR